MRPLLYILFCCLPFAGRGQIITTVAGNGQLGTGGDGGPATAAQLNQPGNVEVDKKGNIYIGDAFNHKIRKVDGVTKVITTYAGTGTSGHSGDGGLASNAQINAPGALTIDSAGNLFFGGNSHYIRRVDAITGIITTIAGIGMPGYSGDGGLATNAQLHYPTKVAFDKDGNMYISEVGNRRIRKVDAAGVISTIAGNGIIGYSGDGGPAINAEINSPTGIVCDNDGNVYFSDNGNGRTRKIDISTGIITTIAGDGTFTYVGDGLPATSASVDSRGLAIDNIGNIFLAEVNSNRIRKIHYSTGIISTVAGVGTSGFSGDGSIATIAELNGPVCVALDSCNNIYIGDNQNKRIRKVTFHPDCFPTNINEPTPFTFTLSPNPANTDLTITSSSTLEQINITNTLGQQLHHQTCNSEKLTLNIEHLPPGLYYLHLTDTHHTHHTEKLIKQ